MKNVIVNINFWFPKRLYEIRKNILGQNCSSQEDIKIYSEPFFDRKRSFCFSCTKPYEK